MLYIFSYQKVTSKKKEYDKAQFVSKRIEKFFQDDAEDNFVSIVNRENRHELNLSDAMRTELINSLHSLRYYGPGHPVSLGLYDLIFANAEFKVELKHSLINNMERVYLNVILDDEENATLKEYRYISEELNIWARMVGIITK